MVFSSFDFTKGCPEPNNSFHSSRTETLALLKSISVTPSWNLRLHLRRGITTNSCILFPKKGPKYLKWTFCAIIYTYSTLRLDLSQKEKTTLKVLVKNAKEKAIGMQFPSLLLYFFATEMKLWKFYCDWTWEIKSCLRFDWHTKRGCMGWNPGEFGLSSVRLSCIVISLDFTVYESSWVGLIL